MRLIINADDFGLSSAVNEAIVRSFEMGIIDRTSAIANAPLFANACQLAIEKGFENHVGVHFNIIEGRSLSPKITEFHSLCAKDGVFTYRRNKKLFFSRGEVDAISAECEEQIKRFHKQGLKPTHFDSHEHVHTEWFIFRAIEPLLRVNKLSSVRKSQNIGNFSFRKRVYKRVFNSYLKKRKLIAEEFSGDYSTFMRLKEFSEMSNAVVEIVVHPTFNPLGVVIDAETGEELVQQLKKLKDFIPSLSQTTVG